MVRNKTNIKDDMSNCDETFKLLREDMRLEIDEKPCGLSKKGGMMELKT